MGITDDVRVMDDVGVAGVIGVAAALSDIWPENKVVISTTKMLL